MKKKLLDECLKIALRKLHKHPRKESYKHYTFIVQDNQIVGYGTNKPAEAPEGLGYADYQFIHSEYDAFKKLKGIIQRDRDFDAVNIRLNKLGQMRNSLPCPCCMNFLKSFRCKRIYFSTSVGFGKLVNY